MDCGTFTYLQTVRNR